MQANFVNFAQAAVVGRRGAGCRVDVGSRAALRVTLASDAFARVFRLEAAGGALAAVIRAASPWLTEDALSNSAQTELALAGRTELALGDGVLNCVTRLQFDACRGLRRVAVGSHSLKSVTAFVLEEMAELREVEVGTESFCLYLDDIVYFNDSLTELDLEKSQIHDFPFRVLRCPKLQSIRIGASSFWGYSEMVVAGTETPGVSCRVRVSEDAAAGRQLLPLPP